MVLEGLTLHRTLSHRLLPPSLSSTLVIALSFSVLSLSHRLPSPYLSHRLPPSTLVGWSFKDHLARGLCDTRGLLLGHTTATEIENSLEELSVKTTEELVKHLSVKDEEITRLREDIKLMSAQLKIKAQEELESQMASDQDLNKRVIKLEFWLHKVKLASFKGLQKEGKMSLKIFVLS